MANLTAKDFNRIAATVRDLRAAVDAIEHGNGLGRDNSLAMAFDSATRDLAAILSEHNGKFDAERFGEACGATQRITVKRK